MERYRGRGALSNPPPRYLGERTEGTDDGWYREELPDSIATQVRPEPARSIISRNDSPDISFEQSINPYRGCEHGCIYCMAGDTPILMADGSLRPLAEIRAGDAIFGTERQGWYRRYVRTRVLAHWSVIKPAYRVTLEDGTELVAGADHRFLTERGWKFVTGAQPKEQVRPALTTADKLMGTGAFAGKIDQDEDYRRGYLCGHVETQRFVSSMGSELRRPMQAIRTEGDQALRSWHAGCSDGILHISNTDPVMIGRIGAALRTLVRLFHSVDPAIVRERDITGQAVKSAARLRIASIEPLGRALRLYDITTGTEDFIANGIVSHNCYARPSHAYMDLSPGIDFETKIFYKADAARRLEEELAKPGYVPKQITLGANTDPYQPLERRLGVTRSILEVLERTRHPLSIVTKGALILRDLDLLSSLARDRLVNVFVSLTTLDVELKRTLEPRAASPAARLRVVRELAAAGVPTGVLVAPIIPAVNDSELERIVAAVAAAGAASAGYVLLRLPHELRQLFRQWLDEHLPDRAEHVMALVRDARGGRDNDPRFGTRMVGTGAWAQLLRDRFALACKRHGIDQRRLPEPSAEHFRPPGRGGQMTLPL